MSDPRTALFDGTDLATFGVVEDLGGLYSVAPRRGSNYTAPGRDGEMYAPKPKAAYTISIGIALFALDVDGSELADEDAKARAFNQRWLDLIDLVDVGQGVLTRRLHLPGPTLLDEECAAELVDGMQVSLLGATAGRCVLTFRNLDGGWTEAVGS